MDINDFLSRLAEVAAKRNSEIAGNIQGREALLQKITIDLTTARSIDNALKISVPFKSVAIEDASDSNTLVYLALGDNSLDSMRNAKKLRSNDSFEFSSMVSSAFLYWSAQSGKQLTLVFSTTGTFKPGSQISVLSGGVSIADGDTLTSNLLTGGVATIAAPAGAATKILDADTARKSMKLYIDNDSWIGDASVSPGARGVLYMAGLIEIPSTAAHYIYPVSGTTNVFGNDYR